MLREKRIWWASGWVAALPVLVALTSPAPPLAAEEPAQELAEEPAEEVAVQRTGIGVVKSVPASGASPTAHVTLEVTVPSDLRDVTDTCKGYPIEHVQAITTLRDHGDGKTRWIITGSKNWAGWMALIEAEGAPPEQGAKAEVVWHTFFDKDNPATAYNHPGDVQILGDTLVVALQNYAGKPGFPTYCPLHRPDDPEPDAVGFYDLSDPRQPRYVGKMTSVEVFGKAQELSDLVLFAALEEPSCEGCDTVNVLVVGPGSEYFYSTGLSPELSSWKATQLVPGSTISVGAGSFMVASKQSTYGARVFLDDRTPTAVFEQLYFQNGVHGAAGDPTSTVSFDTTTFSNCGFDVHTSGWDPLPRDTKVLGPFVSADPSGRAMITCVGPWGGPFKLELFVY